MRAKSGSLTDIASSVMTNKSERELEKIKKESIVRRKGTLEDQITQMYAPKPQQQEEKSE